MAKKASTAVKTTNVSSLVSARIARGSGRGISTDQADNIVPLIYILQAMSPQVMKRNPLYIEGAEPGSIWLRGVEDPIVAGEDGILFQPCSFSKDWVEWIPRDAGGGFVGRHPTLPADAKNIGDQRRPLFVRPNGNQVRETRYHAGYVYDRGGAPMRFVIPMSGSGHVASKNWMTNMGSKRTDEGGIPDSFALLYTLRTQARSNALGEWYGWDIQYHGWVRTDEEYQLGEELWKAMESGAKVLEDPMHDNEVASDEI